MLYCISAQKYESFSTIHVHLRISYQHLTNTMYSIIMVFIPVAKLVFLKQKYYFCHGTNETLCLGKH